MKIPKILYDMSCFAKIYLFVFSPAVRNDESPRLNKATSYLSFYESLILEMTLRWFFCGVFLSFFFCIHRTHTTTHISSLSLHIDFFTASLWLVLCRHILLSFVSMLLTVATHKNFAKWHKILWFICRQHLFCCCFLLVVWAKWEFCREKSESFH